MEDKERYQCYLDELDRVRWSCAQTEGKIAFDLFAPTVAKLLKQSARIRELVSLKYPFIILDEFQDTDSDQWEVVTELGMNSCLISLADPEQQIYRWKGADPKRLTQYQIQFGPTCIDLKQTNFRSAGTDIASFGNEILAQKFTKKSEEYIGIEIIRYGQPNFCNKDMAFKQLNLAVIHARKRLIESGRADWSLAVLTGSKEATKRISEGLSNPPLGCAAIKHRPIFDLEAAVLGAGVLSSLLERDNSIAGQDRFIRSVLSFLRGRNGDRKPKVEYLKSAQKIDQDFAKYLINRKTVSANSVCGKLLKIHTSFCDIELVGDPVPDWLRVRDLLEKSIDKRLNDVGQSTRFLRLLEHNGDLRSLLMKDWQINGRYANAMQIVSDAFVQEHFALSKKPENGVVVMNIHKSKGKEFDEVIIFDGFSSMRGGIVSNGFYSRICFENAVNRDTAQNLRVGVTRARHKTTILTPKHMPCALLSGI